MTHVPETGAINRLHFSGASFWYVCYAYLAPIRTLFNSKPESGAHVTEMMTYDWSMIITYVLMCLS